MITNTNILGDFFDLHYSHTITDLHCGMDFTLIELTSTPKTQLTNENTQ
jgi:hypothetical protein